MGYNADRDLVRQLLTKGRFIEIHVTSSTELVQERDSKGLYKKACEGKISVLTGLDAGYEVPDQPELQIDTDNMSIRETVNNILPRI